MSKRGKSSPKKRGDIPKRGSTPPEDFPTKRELIVIVRPQAGLRVTREGVTSIEGVDITPMANLLASEGVTLEPLFGESEERIKHEAASLAPTTDVTVPDLSIYYRVRAPDERLDELAERLRELEIVEAAYVKPPAEPPVAIEKYAEMLNDLLPLAEEAPIITPDFTGRQGYLDAAPRGVYARFAWTKAGGRGAGVNIIDIEWGWNFTHEDLTQNQGGVVSGTNSSDNNHGTAVLGEFSGDLNTFGIIGICPDARVSAVSLVTHLTSSAIRIAANRLQPGDIMLLEVHRAGPRHNFTRVPANRDATTPGYIAIEWWPDDYDAIRYAVGRGIIVVEAAGNGAENLDDAIYDSRPAGFPASWRNPFNSANPSSGAIIVGAGNPPAGTHGRNRQPITQEPYVDRARCAFSNYGSRVDAQGWGWEVTTTGYGDLQGGTNRNQWYGDQFSGTSSASPIVVGALGCVQGYLRAKGKPLLTPAQARTKLRATGSPQQDGPGWTESRWGAHPPRPRTQQIGNRPDLKQLIIGCFIATAAYGSELAPSVQFLRDFRDNVVLRSKYKRAFEKLLEIYYRFSPSIAEKMEQNEALKHIMKGLVVGPTVSLLEAFVRKIESTGEKRESAKS